MNTPDSRTWGSSILRTPLIWVCCFGANLDWRLSRQTKRKTEALWGVPCKGTRWLPEAFHVPLLWPRNDSHVARCNTSAHVRLGLIRTYYVVQNPFKNKCHSYLLAKGGSLQRSWPNGNVTNHCRAGLCLFPSFVVRLSQPARSIPGQTSSATGYARSSNLHLHQDGQLTLRNMLHNLSNSIF